ncbi:hypothetical protein FQA39_LY12733 [Lamprigera yunnana]|nr:hypothetical protein FQA39_LY12733 [Lamprigera yunnana]
MKKICILPLFFMLAELKNTSLDLCSSQKSESTCLCRIQMGASFPVKSADCTRMDLRDFPRDEQIPDVECIDLSHNSITYLNSSTNNFHIISIKLSFNEITFVSRDFFANTPNLRKLDLSHNRIMSFSDSNIFVGLKNLTVLNLSFNSLSTLPEDTFKSLVNLQELDLSYNHLGDSDFFKGSLGVSKSIEVLKIDGLGITNLGERYFEEAASLKYLSIVDNPLTEIPHVPYTVTYFDLSGTHIEHISAKYLDYHSLKVLKLNRLKRLQKVEHYAFYNLMSLEELSLTEAKKLKEFSDLAFGVLLTDKKSSLKKLTLSGCGIKRLNSTFLTLFKNLEQIDLQNNPWECDCEVLWLQQLNESLHRKDSLRCKFPYTFRTKLITELIEDEVPNCSSVTYTTQKILISILGVLVAILTVLIFYLFYLGPFFQTSKGIGPGSPYYRGNPVGIDPNRAETLEFISP